MAAYRPNTRTKLPYVSYRIVGMAGEHMHSWRIMASFLSFELYTNAHIYFRRVKNRLKMTGNSGNHDCVYRIIQMLQPFDTIYAQSTLAENFKEGRTCARTHRDVRAERAPIEYHYATKEWQASGSHALTTNTNANASHAHTAYVREFGAPSFRTHAHATQGQKRWRYGDGTA